MRHEHLAIQNVPDDVLSYVFDELAQADPPGFLRELHQDHRKIHQYSLGWITATHVCRRWRTLILSLSSLWAAVVCNIPLAFETVLERAGTAPLTLHIVPQIHASSMWLTRAHEVALERMGDVRSLHCSISTMGLLDRARDVLTRKTLPLLTELDISNFAEGEVSRSLTTPEGALHLDAPNLRVVSMHNLRCNITSAHLRSLEFFHHEGAVDSTGHFLRVLRNTPLLEVLRCSIDCLPFNDTNPSGESSVSLAHLKRLCAWRLAYARNAEPDAAFFLRHLSFPETCIFHYRDVSDGPQTGWRTVFETCADRLRQLPYDAMSIHASFSDGEDTVRLGVFFVHDALSPFGQHPAPYIDWECCTSPVGPRASTPPAPGVRLEIRGADGDPWRFDEILPEIVPKVQCNYITHLVLNDIDDHDEDDIITLSRVLRLLNAVTTVFIRFNINGPNALLTLATGRDDSVLPALRDIIIEQTYMLEDNWDEEKVGMWWRCLIVVLEQRKKAGNTVRSVRLTGQWIDSPQPAFDRSVEKSLAEHAQELVGELHDDRIW